MSARPAARCSNLPGRPPEGWAKDEAPGQIGKTLVFPPWFKDREEELRAGLEEAEFA